MKTDMTLQKLKELEKRVEKVEQTIHSSSSPKSSLNSSTNLIFQGMNERHRIREEKEARIILKETFGVISKKRGKELLGSLEQLRKRWNQ